MEDPWSEGAPEAQVSTEAGGRGARRAIRWALVAVGALVASAAVVVLVVVVSGERTVNAGTPAGAGVGSESQPVPLGTAAGVGGGWRLTVRSVTRHAQALLGPLPQATPKNAEAILLSVVIGYSGPGDAAPSKLLARTYVTGRRPVAYPPVSGDLNCVEPGGNAKRASRPLNQVTAHVFTRTTVGGHLCFQVSRRDATALRLFVEPPGCRPSASRPACEREIWFALGAPGAAGRQAADTP
ncbi:MAG TPA: hypothetical protein VFX08_08520 [Gaiella sp.]|nr:hypothetical protein [Gaiella sp.]